MGSEDANKQVVMRYVEAFNSGDQGTLRGLFTEDALIYGILGWGGIEEILTLWAQVHVAFRVELTIESLIAEGDIVAARYSERGTFAAPYRGIEPTGKSYEMIALEWFAFKDGKIYRRWAARDAATHAEQTGLN